MLIRKQSAGRRRLPGNYMYDAEIRRDYPLIAGIDEAGRGSLAGPVVAAAVMLKERHVITGLDDSKKIPEKERRRIFWDIVNSGSEAAAGIVSAGTIDRINILQATKQAMKTAVMSLSRRPDILLIDALILPDIDIKQKAIIKGDSKSASIAAASIIAKVLRDDIMRDYHEEYPSYDFITHKGYGTDGHIKFLLINGPCPIHRKSFGKVMDLGLPFNE
ncbi:MAG: ribonuclease HII [Nitrospirae bacterium]|nr:ribonuclease HII [Nitrospirota bacterium]